MPNQIDHIILLLLENQSFDGMLGCYREVYADIEGIAAPRQSANFNTDTSGVKYEQLPTTHWVSCPLCIRWRVNSQSVITGFRVIRLFGECFDNPATGKNPISDSSTSLSTTTVPQPPECSRAMPCIGRPALDQRRLYYGTCDAGSGGRPTLRTKS